MISTLGEAYDAGWTLRFYCRGHKGDGMKKHRACVAYHDADMATMLWTHGRRYPISNLSGRLRCPSCQSRMVAVAFDAPGAPTFMRIGLRRRG